MDNKRYEDLTFTNDFIFCKILENSPDLAKELLEIILGFKISKVEVQKQKVLDSTPDAKSVRLDVYAADEDSVIYDIEMQTTKPRKLAKRSRYYQSKIDNSLIEKDAPYETLRKSYIIFICLSDPFAENRCMYTFENICREHRDLSLGDEAYKIFVNTKGNTDDVSECLKQFLDYLRNNKASNSFTQKLENKVSEAHRNMEWRRDYMAMSVKYHDYMMDGLEQGIVEGETNERHKVIITALSNGMSKKDITKFLGYSDSEIQEVIEKSNLQTKC